MYSRHPRATADTHAIHGSRATPTLFVPVEDGADVDDNQQLTELDEDDADALAATALETEYVTRLESHLADEYDETVPTGTPRAFERDDGVRAVTFEAEDEAGGRPILAVTVHVDEGTVVQATAERHGPDVDGTVELLFPAEIAPRPETAVNDLLEPAGGSVDVTVDESGDVTSYTLEVGTS